jgi:asparagine synthase (glutamine-hydrolysing)
MCGVAGLIDPTQRSDGAALTAAADRMAAALAHRGPDGAGHWVDAAAGVALGHRRLAVIDLTPTGAQPMASSCGRYVVAYNGQIYNYLELKRELAARGRRFRGGSDTEVLVEGCAQWGVAPMLRRLNGMFAFALWDREERALTLARDRLGIKPLYWGQPADAGGLFLFASELKGMTAHGGWRPAIDEAAVAAFIRCGYVPSPASIYRGIHKLPPGHLLRLALGRAPEIAAWWRLDEAIAAAGANRRGDEAAVVDQLDGLLRDAVRRQMVADVPIGVLLSGGIDSTLVAALMQTQSTAPVRSFTIGFAERGFDESAAARAVAGHLGTDHTELILDPSEVRALIPELPRLYDEPFADASQLPTCLVARLARKRVTVALSGDGGDESFFGYNRYTRAAGLWRRLSRLPVPLRRALSGGLRGVAPSAWDRLFAALPGAPRQPGEKLHKLADILPLRDDDAVHDRLTALSADSALLLCRPSPAAAAPPPIAGDAVERMAYRDSLAYLPDDILTKLDRASMAVGLEARVPLLDHRVVEFAWSLPSALKLDDGVGKRPLRQLLDRYVPRALVDRPKSGFAAPIADWLGGPLRDWAEAQLAPGRLAAEGFFVPGAVARLWQEHLDGRRNHHQQLWALLMFQAWLAEPAAP